MHPRIAELFAYLDQQQERLRTTYESVPAQARDTRSGPDRWSPSEILAHLVLIERRVGQNFVGLIAKARTAGLRAETETGSILPTIDLTRVTNRAQKITAPAPVDPRTSGDRFEWTDYEAARSGLKSAVLTGDGLALSEISHPHPVFGPLDLYHWVAFAGAHAARHEEQMREEARLLQ